MIQVVNLTKDLYLCTHYCDNPESFEFINNKNTKDYSILYNPFIMKNSDIVTDFKNYKNYFLNKIKTDSKFCLAINELKLDSKKGYVLLGCFCLTGFCHCDFIKKYIED